MVHPISSHEYQGVTAEKIHFTVDADRHLSASIATPRLMIRSVQPTDIHQYAELFGNPEVIAKYGTGQRTTEAEMADIVNNFWVKKWKENNPFSGFAMFLRTTGEFVGHIDCYGEHPGESEIALLISKKFWNQGLATEATQGIAEYDIAAVQEGYESDGKPLTTIVATARPDNLASVRILQKSGMHFVKQEERFGALRNFYSITLDEVQKKLSEKTASSCCGCFGFC